MEKMKTLIHNLSKREQEVMKHLEKWRGFTISNSNKSGAVVKMDNEIFIIESSCKLSNQNNYKLLWDNPVLKHSKMNRDLIKRLKKPYIKRTFHIKFKSKAIQEVIL